MQQLGSKVCIDAQLCDSNLFKRAENTGYCGFPALPLEINSLVLCVDVHLRTLLRSESSYIFDAGRKKCMKLFIFVNRSFLLMNLLLNIQCIPFI